MAIVSSMWLWISDDNGSRTLEIHIFDEPLKTDSSIKIDKVAFYEDLTDGSKRLLCKTEEPC